jgi:hypothetical protein
LLVIFPGGKKKTIGISATRAPRRNLSIARRIAAGLQDTTTSTLLALTALVRVGVGKLFESVGSWPLVIILDTNGSSQRVPPQAPKEISRT